MFTRLKITKILDDCLQIRKKLHFFNLEFFKFILCVLVCLYKCWYTL